MTWMTPFRVSMSVVVTLTLSFRTTPPSTTLMLIGSPSTVFGRVELDDLVGHDLTGDDVVEQDLLERLLVGEQAVERPGRQGGECVVRRREDGERAIALERLDETRLLGGGEERLERTGCRSGVHDVLQVGRSGPARSRRRGCHGRRGRRRG